MSSIVSLKLNVIQFVTNHQFIQMYLLNDELNKLLQSFIRIVLDEITKENK